MTRTSRTFVALTAAFVALQSLPFLVRGAGLLALVGFVPLLCMERLAVETPTRRLWPWHYAAFFLWNFATTFWVCNATIGGGLFASLANALQMSLIFGLFRLSRKRFTGILPYVFLAVTWIAWERHYLTCAQISWPWLVLGNAFARTTWAVQWYEFTGSLGGSLWVWACNIALFRLIASVSDGGWRRIGAKARVAALSAIILLPAAPLCLSIVMYHSFHESDKPVKVMIVQPNINPYDKFQAMTQERQNALFMGLADEALAGGDFRPDIIIGPETFTGDVLTNSPADSRTLGELRSFIEGKGVPSLLIGASAHTLIRSQARPSETARERGNGLWTESHNVAVMLRGDDSDPQLFYKSKLVVGVEMMPYPRFFRPIDEALGGVIGRNVGQERPSTLRLRTSSGEDVPMGVAVCYESVYGEYCTGYVRDGAQVLAVITNDAWWGDTPGYVQHCSYSSLRAIETRRDIARCGNTGISCIINQRGDVSQASPWWEQAVIEGEVNLNCEETFFVREGDITGRLCAFLFILLFCALIVRCIVPKSLQ